MALPAKNPRPTGGELPPLWRRQAEFRLGTCPVCKTSVFVDDDFVRRHGAVMHVECRLYSLLHSAGFRG
jgi:hypothetical protein